MSEGVYIVHYYTEILQKIQENTSTRYGNFSRNLIMNFDFTLVGFGTPIFSTSFNCIGHGMPCPICISFYNSNSVRSDIGHKNTLSHFIPFNSICTIDYINCVSICIKCIESNAKFSSHYFYRFSHENQE